MHLPKICVLCCPDNHVVILKGEYKVRADVKYTCFLQNIKMRGTSHFHSCSQFLQYYKCMYCFCVCLYASVLLLLLLKIPFLSVSPRRPSLFLTFVFFCFIALVKFLCRRPPLKNLWVVLIMQFLKKESFNLQLVHISYAVLRICSYQPVARNFLES